MKHFVILLLLFAPFPVASKTWLVGPTRQYTAPSKVESLVANGDTVLVDSGSYVGDVSVWNANDLVLRCPDGIARFNANGNIAQQKGIWVIYGNNAYVEGFEFFGAAISEANGDNGAGIRMQGYSFTVRRCYIHDNQDGILSGSTTDTGNILIEACEFYNNGVESGPDAGYEHNIYIGHCTSLTVKFCYFHSSVQGHEIKTRASSNYILYNHIVDGPTGDGSYSIDIPNGGRSFVVGNSIEKGPMTANSTVISYGEEGIINPDSEFYFANNTIVTNRNSTTFLKIQPGTTPLIANNIFAGNGHPLTSTDTVANVISTDTSFFHFRDVMNYDYHPIADFPGLYSAHVFGTTGNDPFPLAAEYEYVNPLDSVARDWESEVGAFNEIPSAAVQHSAELNSSLSNYPNPFTTETIIPLPAGTIGNLELFDICGNQMGVIYHQDQNGLVIERGNLEQGIYFYRITVAEQGTIAEGPVVIGE